MHKHFADWYGLVSIRHDAPTLEARWGAVEDLSGSLKLTQVPDLIRVFFSLQGGDSLRSEIRAAVKAKDQTYLLEGDRIELPVIAGGVIANAVKASSNLADAIALAVACADAQGLRNAQRLQGVVDEAMRYLAEESVSTRKLDAQPVTGINSDLLKKSLADKRAVAVTSPEAAWNSFDEVLKDIIDQHKKQTSSINRAFKDALDRQREESDILWWLFSEHTLDGTKPLSKLTIAEGCFWGAKDLATLTRSIPGPLAAPAFLQKMLKLVKNQVPESLKISDAVDACDKAWKRTWISSLPVKDLPDLCPMLFAITKSDEVGGSTNWTSAFENATRLKANKRLAPARMALQVYNELILLTALSVKG